MVGEKANGVHKDSDGRENAGKACGIGRRHLIVGLLFLGSVTMYLMRVNISVAIVSMVNHTALDARPRSTSAAALNGGNDTQPGKAVTCQRESTNSSSSKKSQDGDFTWDSEMQGLVLSSFFWGYVATQLPGGILAKRYGAKWLIAFGMLLTSVFTLLGPPAARLGLGYLIAARVMIGLGGGLVFPGVHAMLAMWIPPSERSFMCSFVYAGISVGSVLGLFLSGLLASQGWQWAFYPFALIGLIWITMWIFLADDTPGRCGRMSDKEKDFIETAIWQTESSKQDNKLPTPWRKIFKSGPFYGLLCAHVGCTWGFYTLMTQLPTYLHGVLNFDSKQNGMLSALPYLMMWIVSVLTGFISDALSSRNLVTVGTIRKIMNSIAYLVPAVALVAVSYTGCDAVLTLILINLAIGINGAFYSGFLVNHIDLSPNFAGPLMGFCNFWANVCGIVTPYVTGVIVRDSGDVGQWRIVFFISAAVYVGSNTAFLILGSGNEQPWNRKETIANGNNKS